MEIGLFNAKIVFPPSRSRSLPYFYSVFIHPPPPISITFSSRPQEWQMEQNPSPGFYHLAIQQKLALIIW